MKNAIVIGGTSSISKEIIESLEQNEYDIHIATFKNKEKIYGSYNWFYLNLDDKKTVYDFLYVLNNKKFDKIILIPSSSASNKDILETDLKELSLFYSNFFCNYIFLIKELYKNLSNNGSMIYISSDAANFPNKDINYSTVKGAIQTFIMSLSTKSIDNQSIFSIAPGLIFDTPAHREHPENNKKDILLMTKKSQIIDIILKSNKFLNGKTIRPEGS